MKALLSVIYVKSASISYVCENCIDTVENVGKKLHFHPKIQKTHEIY